MSKGTPKRFNAFINLDFGGSIDILHLFDFINNKTSGLPKEALEDAQVDMDSLELEVPEALVVVANSWYVSVQLLSPSGSLANVK
jgi:hypothetical protein